MTILSRLALEGTLLIAPQEVLPLNSPPQWDTQPGAVVSFVQGVAASFDMNDYSSDPDSDPITFTMNTGTAALPTGVTWTAGTGVLAYDGIGAVDSTSGHIITLDDGTDQVASASFGISIADLSWPAYGAHSQSAANVAGIDTTLTDPLFSPWQRKKDLVYLQGRYPSASRVQSTYDGVVLMKADNSNLRLLEYVYPQRTDNTGTTDILGLMWEVVEENSGESAWRGVDVDSASLIYDDQGRIFLNPNYEGTDPANGKTTFIDACWDKYEAKSGSGAVVDLRRAVHGVFPDSTDYQDNKPNQYESDGTTPANIDYLKPKSSGSTDPVHYRNGLKYGVTQFRTKFGSDQVWSSNGGRDRESVNEVTANNEWAGFWDHRLSENFQQRLGLEKKTGVNEMELIYSSSQNRLENAVQSALISAEMVDRTATNRLGKGLVSLDFVFEWSGTDPTSVSDIPQDYYEAARFICGLACLEDKFMAGPCLERGVMPFPYMDEYVYDPGDPVGGTPSIGSIDNTDTDLPLTLRSADNNGFYWQEYDNVLWVVNLNPPTGLTDWPQAAEDTVTLPDPGVGKVWRHADSSYTNVSRTTGGTAAENQSPLVNDGALVGATLSIPRWHARMLVRADS